MDDRIPVVVLTAAPKAVREVVAQWRAAGSPAQTPVAWRRERWLAALPERRAQLSALPDQLDRAVTRKAAARAGADREGALAVFLSAMAWGYGSVSYGPFRTQRVLKSTPDALDRLFLAAQTVRESGALAGYAALAGPARLNWLGPAFGTKYLYFCSDPTASQPAVVLDSLVAAWLTANTSLTLHAGKWSLLTYELYLEHLSHWADSLDLTTVELEYCIFWAALAERRRSQGK